MVTTADINTVMLSHSFCPGKDSTKAPTRTVITNGHHTSPTAVINSNNMLRYLLLQLILDYKNIVKRKQKTAMM
jgi:hypothetical protein